MVHIRPRVGMYSAFSRLNYKPWYAIAEFVDNSIQSFLAHKDNISKSKGVAASLTIRIEISPDRIVVSDDAAGIAAIDFSRAFTPAERPRNTSGLSEFGLGMKAAACWFATQWSVRTKALGERVERTIRFNVPHIVEQNIEELDPEEQPARAEDHYTTLTLEGLHHQPRTRTVAKIKRYLGGMYRRFLAREDITILYNGVPVDHSLPEVLVAPLYNDPGGPRIRWYKEFSLKLDAEHHVHGWAGLREKASTTEAGFAVFRRDRLVMGGADDPYRPQEVFGTPNKYAFQRVFGELSVEGFSVSHTKDGLQWDEWEPDILDWLRNELDKDPTPLLRQADGFRARAGRSPISSGFGSSAVSGTTDAIQSHAGQAISEQLDQPATEAPAPDELPPPLEVMASREVELELKHHQQVWRVSVELVREPAAEDWYAFSHHHAGVGEPSIIRIRLNLSHPFSEQFLIGDEEELDPVLRLAAGMAIAEVTAQEAGVRAAPTIRRNLNHLLREALWRRQ